MAKGLITLCLFCMLRATTGAQNQTGSPLTCFNCKSGGSCSLTPQTCSLPQDACIILREHNTLGAENLGTYQSCANSRQSLTGFLAFYFGDKVVVEIESELCKNNDCNTESTPSRLAINTVRNGLQCPACYAPGFQSCESNGHVLCTGGADQCAVVVGTLVQGDVSIPFAARGCATEAACSIETLESGVFSYKLIKAQCSPAPKAEINSASRSSAWGPFSLGSIIPQVLLFLPSLLGLFC
uniref:UPAR/Ly6 domain-containing protein n=1 Tax=Pelusios castaneus TaxID=367368 RepID=A0A8C8S6E1_9SAUR